MYGLRFYILFNNFWVISWRRVGDNERLRAMEPSFPNDLRRGRGGGGGGGGGEEEGTAKSVGQLLNT